MTPLQHELFSSNQVVNLSRFALVNLDRFQVVSLSRSRVVNFIGFCNKHLITFENTGKIILSNSIETQAFQKIGVTGQEKIQSLSNFNFEYLDKHRIRINENC